MGIQVANLAVFGLEEEVSMFWCASESSKEVLIIHDAVDGGKVYLLRFLKSNSDEHNHQ